MYSRKHLDYIAAAAGFQAGLTQVEIDRLFKQAIKDGTMTQSVINMMLEGVKMQVAREDEVEKANAEAVAALKQELEDAKELAKTLAAKVELESKNAVNLTKELSKTLKAEQELKEKLAKEAKDKKAVEGNLTAKEQSQKAANEATALTAQLLKEAEEESALRLQDIKDREFEVERLKKELDENKKNNIMLENYYSYRESISTNVIEFIESVLKYKRYIFDKLSIKQGETELKPLHEYMNLPFLYSVTIAIMEATKIHIFFWGSAIIAAVFAVILTITAYIDENSIVPFVKSKAADALKKGRLTEPTFKVVYDDIYSWYKQQKSHTANVVWILFTVNFTVSFLQFSFNGYSYDTNYSVKLILDSEATIQDFINNFKYLYTYKNIVMALMIAGIQHIIITLSVVVKLASILKDVNEG